MRVAGFNGVQELGSFAHAGLVYAMLGNQTGNLSACRSDTLQRERDAVFASFGAEFQRAAKTADGATVPEPATWDS